MSGILCAYSALGIDPDLTRYLDALHRLAHRGHDGEGTILRENLFLGVQISAVRRGPAEQQPLVGADGKIIVAMDGHIHERESLADSLAEKGHQIDTASDAELMLCAYAEFGDRCFEKLKGIWAVVLWDERTNRLIVSRDRLGVRPLYYIFDGHNFLFASEIKSILSLNPRARDINLGRVRDFVESGRIDDWTGTLFATIQPVPPGTVIKIRANKAVSTRFWTLRPSAGRNLSPESLLDKLVTAIDYHTPTEVSVGLALSGGIDSSSIAGILANSRLRGNHVIRAFSITPPKTTDESFLIDATVRQTGIPHSYVELGEIDYPRLLTELIQNHDEPIQYSGVFYQFILRQRMAEAGCKAVLVGYGADEIFSGYEYLAMPFLASLLAGGRLVGAARFIIGARDFLQISASRILANALQHSYVGPNGNCRTGQARHWRGKVKSNGGAPRPSRLREPPWLTK